MRKRQLSRKRRLIGALILGGAFLVAGCAEDTVLDPGEPSQAPALFVVNSLGETLSRVLLADRSVNANAVLVGVAPNSIAIAPDGRTGYVVSSRSNRVDIVDLDQPAAIDVIDVGVGASPFAIALFGAGEGYVSNFNTDEVVHLDLAGRRIRGRIPVGRAPEGLLTVTHGAGADLYVAITGFDSLGSFRAGEVAVVAIPADTVRARLHVGVNPQGFALAPDGRVHVVCTGDYAARHGRVFIIEPTGPTVVDSVEVGGWPSAVAVLPGNQGLVVGWSEIRSYAPGKPVTDLTAFAGTTGFTSLAWDEAEDVVYVTHFSDSKLHALDAAADSILWSVPTGQGPVAVAVRR